MVEPAQPSIASRSEIVRFCRWLFSWRNLRRILIVLAWVATIIALLYGEENWRGRRAWNKYRQGLEAQGEQLDLKAFIPKSVPDEQNFAATPFITSLFDKSISQDDQSLWGDDFSRAETKRPSLPQKTERGRRRFIDLAGFKEAFEALRAVEPAKHKELHPGKLDPKSRAEAASSVLEALRGSQVHFAELRLASRRLYSRYPVNYDLENPWGILLPHVSKLKGACSRLQVRACAELALEQSENALEDLRLLFYLADSVKDEPFLISYLVRLSCLHIAMQPIWEGLAEHRWSDAQLRELQSRLQQYDFLADLKRPLDGERAAGVLTADLLYRQKYRLSTLGDPAGSNPSSLGLGDLIGRIAPHGWYYQEQLNYCRLYEAQFGGTFDSIRKRAFPSAVESRAHELEGAIAGGRLGRTLNGVIHHQLLASLLLPALGTLPRKAATGQTVADEAALACALERYRLANGQFPEQLAALVPRFIEHLPNDVLSGEPYKYRRISESAFTLYSVGWNEKDDGGVPGKTLFDEKDGDWVWESAPPEAGVRL